ncbi:MAG: DUF3810 domain-containing protein [Clostridia bacterium]|nr:DUF3810 domain-containing protein [Clostridia bacterium]
MDTNVNTSPIATESTPKKRSFLRILPLWFLIPAFTALLCVVFHIISRNSPAFANFFTANISSVFRFLLGKATNVLPFSLAETAVLCLPVIIALFMWWACKQINKGNRARPFIVLLTVCCVCYSLFVLTFACGYGTDRLDKRIGIERKKVSADELYYTASCLMEEVNKYAATVEYGADGFSVMPYSYDEMSSKLCAAYERLAKKYDFIKTYSTRVKPVAMSVPMSYAHTTGIYVPFTGEANINIDFPDYSIPFTAAHELAHQRGISREDEANFIAFLVCMESNDNYIRYSGYLNMLEYTLNPLYGANADYYREVYLDLNGGVQGELRAYSAFFNKYRDSTASKVNNAVNDTYLKVQGTEGTKSYGMVVDLAVAYYLQNKEN